jgi:hypothetical protein
MDGEASASPSWSFFFNGVTLTSTKEKIMSVANDFTTEYYKPFVGEEFSWLQDFIVRLSFTRDELVQRLNLKSNQDLWYVLFCIMPANPDQPGMNFGNLTVGHNIGPKTQQHIYDVVKGMVTEIKASALSERESGLEKMEDPRPCGPDDDLWVKMARLKREIKAIKAY